MVLSFWLENSERRRFRLQMQSMHKVEFFQIPMCVFPSNRVGEVEEPSPPNDIGGQTAGLSQGCPKNSTHVNYSSVIIVYAPGGGADRLYKRALTDRLCYGRHNVIIRLPLEPRPLRYDYVFRLFSQVIFFYLPYLHEIN